MPTSGMKRANRASEGIVSTMPESASTTARATGRSLDEDPEQHRGHRRQRDHDQHDPGVGEGLLEDELQVVVHVGEPVADLVHRCPLRSVPSGNTIRRLSPPAPSLRRRAGPRRGRRRVPDRSRGLPRRAIVTPVTRVRWGDHGGRPAAARPTGRGRPGLDPVRRARRCCEPRDQARDPAQLGAVRRRRARRHPGPAGRRGRDRGVLPGLAARGRGRAGRAGPAAHRRGRRPGARHHRSRDPGAVDVRRPGDAAQGRERQLRAGRSLGRGQRRHQRAGDRDAHRRAVDGVQRRALRADRPQLGVLGGAAAPPGHGRADRRHRPLHDLGPHPPDRARDRPGAGAADRGRDAALPPVGTQGRARPAGAGADAVAARHRRGVARRPAAAAQPAPDRDPRAARPAPGGTLAGAAARHGLRRPGRHALDAQVGGVPPALGARRPARLAPLPADDAGPHRRRGRARRCSPTAT